jgi:RNA polymerase sigma factor (sigma-70 family)
MSAQDEQFSGRSQFQETSWTVVLGAGRSTTSVSGPALSILCEGYWAPVYAYIRRHGRNEDDAKDLTQAFFEHIIQNDTLSHVRREKGRFRAFLLASLKFFLTDQIRHDTRQKRGGGQAPLSLDDSQLGLEFSRDLAHDEAPDVLFERAWMRVIFRRAFEALRHEFAAKGKMQVFDILSVALSGDPSDVSHAELAKRLNATESAIKSAIHRLRASYAAELKREIARTVLSPEEADDELRRFYSVFAGSKQ